MMRTRFLSVLVVMCFGFAAFACLDVSGKVDCAIQADCLDEFICVDRSCRSRRRTLRRRSTTRGVTRPAGPISRSGWTASPSDAGGCLPISGGTQGSGRNPPGPLWERG